MPRPDPPKRQEENDLTPSDYMAAELGALAAMFGLEAHEPEDVLSDEELDQVSGGVAQEPPPDEADRGMRRR